MKIPLITVERGHGPSVVPRHDNRGGIFAVHHE